MNGVSERIKAALTGVGGGHDAWVMIGRAYFDQLFADQFVRFLRTNTMTRRRVLFSGGYLSQHIDALTMKARQYGAGVIAEFDSIDELRVFDPSYVANTRSPIIRRIAASLGCSESDIRGMSPLKDDTGDVIGFQFTALDGGYAYRYRDAAILPVGEARDQNTGDRNKPVFMPQSGARGIDETPGGFTSAVCRSLWKVRDSPDFREERPALFPVLSFPGRTADGVLLR